MRALLTMTAVDLRRRLRDKSVLIFSLAVPLALMTVLNLLLGGVSEGDLEPVDLAVSSDADDQLAGVVVDALASTGIVDVTVTDSDDPHADVGAGSADLGMVVPSGFTAALTSGEPAPVQFVMGDGAGLSGQVLVTVAQGVVEQLRGASVAAVAAGAAGLEPDRASQLAQQVLDAQAQVQLTQGEASSEQLSTGGMLIAGQAGLFLMFTVGFGVLGLIAEREEGTLVRLRSMPVRSSTIVAAKALTAFVLGVVATGVLLTVGSVLFDVDFGAVPAVAVLVVAAVLAATSLTFVVVRLARTAEQANVVQSIIALVLGMSGGAFFPITATGLVGTIVDLNPIAAFTRGLGITSGGGGLDAIGLPVAIMLGFAAVCLLLSRLIPNRGVAA
ncbi:ABC transporter permease [Ruania albidiflava]|uniref:ABC transporter permease n=2 Tax=Ruania albidiflava TaxID=366586 RepID=UPI0003B63720|nr:ABC transporter permease [Ruania albidiflava]